MIIKILFLCTHNSARSIMAEALLNQLAPTIVESISAGIVSGEIQTSTKIVLEELNINTKGLHSKLVSKFINKQIDYVITVCDQAEKFCPTFPNANNQLHWSFLDPSSFKGTTEEKLIVYRKIRDNIKEKLIDFIQNIETNSNF